jgi:hypothetical protein
LDLQKQYDRAWRVIFRFNDIKKS